MVSFFTDYFFNIFNQEIIVRIKKDLFRRILRLKEDFKFDWSTQVRVDIAKHKDLLKLMYKAGCRTLYIGLESVNPQSLLSIEKKNQTFLKAMDILTSKKNASIKLDFRQKIELDQKE